MRNCGVNSEDGKARGEMAAVLTCPVFAPGSGCTLDPAQVEADARFVAVTPSFQAFVVDLLSRVVERVRAQRMFDGVGIYSGASFFALIADDVLYFKVNDANRPDYEDLGMEAFRPYGAEEEVMGYYQVPDDLLEDVEALRPWAQKALAAAGRKKSQRTGQPKGGVSGLS